MSQSITANGMIVTSLVQSVPHSGVWTAVVDFDQDRSGLTGAAILDVGGAQYVGAFVPELSGSDGLLSKAFVVGGAGGWRRTIDEKHYHSDAGVSASSVVVDVAAAAGETLGSVAIDTALSVDYVRERTTAGRALRAVCAAAGIPWWVGFDGITRVGPRVRSEVVGEYEVLEFDPRWKVATVVASSPASIDVGKVLRAGLDVPMIVRSFDLEVTSERARFDCICEAAS